MGRLTQKLSPRFAHLLIRQVLSLVQQFGTPLQSAHNGSSNFPIPQHGVRSNGLMVGRVALLWCKTPLFGAYCATIVQPRILGIFLACSAVTIECRILRLTAKDAKNLSTASGVAYMRLGAILTSLAAPNPSHKKYSQSAHSS